MYSQQLGTAIGDVFLFSEKRGQASALGKEPVPGRPYPTLTTNGAEGDKNDHSHDSRQHAGPHALTKAPLITGMPSPAEGPEPGPTPHHGKPVPFSLREETRPQLPLRGVVLDGVGARSRIDDHASSLRPRSRTKDSMARRTPGKDSLMRASKTVAAPEETVAALHGLTG